LNNSRSEPSTRPDTSNTSNAPRSDGRTRGSSPPPPYSSPADARPSKAARFAAPDEDDDDEAFPWPLSGEEERQFDKAAQHAISPPPTSRGAPISTPGKRKYSDIDDYTGIGLPTPVTERRFDRLQSDSTPRRALFTSTPASTPTPSRFRDAEQDTGDLVASVMDLLQEKHTFLEKETRESLTSILKRHSLQTKGIVKGREISRLALIAKEAKISELQHRVVTLESELELKDGVIRHLKWQLDPGE